MWLMVRGVKQRAESREMKICGVRRHLSEIFTSFIFIVRSSFTALKTENSGELKFAAKKRSLLTSKVRVPTLQNPFLYDIKNEHQSRPATPKKPLPPKQNRFTSACIGLCVFGVLGAWQNSTLKL
jgi:hypothetical protein